MNARHFISICVLLTALGVGCSREKEAVREEPVAAADSTAKDTVVTIETVKVARGDLPMVLRSPGRISVNVNRTAKVTSTFEGRISSLTHDVGGVVQRGDVMGTIDSPELLNKPLELKAPIGGQVIERHGTVGEAVDKTTELYTISDLKILWCIAEIKERDVALVRTGQSATIRVTAYPLRSFKGKVLLSGQEVEERTRTLETRIEVDNSDGALKPGMFADVELVTTILEDVLVIPDESLQTLEDHQIVFVAEGPNRFRKRIVKVGREQAGRAEILEGLAEGDIVVTRGSFILKSELLKGELGEE
jgi:multidrug efflux pump subunit AcrA (membrane-fusion protein)